MSEQSKQQPDKKVYRKPTLRTIELVADEVLAVGCKVNQTPNVGNNRHCHAPTSCFTKGS